MDIEIELKIWTFNIQKCGGVGSVGGESEAQHASVYFQLQFTIFHGRVVPFSK